MRAIESTEGSTPLTGIEFVRCAPDRAFVIKYIIKIENPGMYRRAISLVSQVDFGVYRCNLTKRLQV
jgi:hypothetical protein